MDLILFEISRFTIHLFKMSFIETIWNRLYQEGSYVYQSDYFKHQCMQENLNIVYSKYSRLFLETFLKRCLDVKSKT